MTDEKLTHDCSRSEDGRPAVVTCGACGASWCEACDPAPAALCHTCHGRGYSTAPTLACGHAPQPTHYAPGTVVTVGAERVDVSGRVMFPGYAVLSDGSHVCPDCADDMQRAEMLTARRFTAYLSADNRAVTTWTGGKLGTVTRCTGNRRQTFVRVTDTHGQAWAGIGPAESGTYVSLRRVGVTR